MFGLKTSDIDSICTTLQAFPEVEDAVIFGSRAKGNFRKGSDVDLALFGQNVNIDTAQQVAFEMNEKTLMPYRFDVLSFADLSNPDLADHIRRVGVIIYSTNKQRIAGEPAGEYLKGK